jgi:putative endonuclease
MPKDVSSANSIGRKSAAAARACSAQPTTDARRARGNLAEDRAAAFLESQGLTIVLRNFARRGGELDIVARHADLLIVAEVRTRSRDDYGGAAASVDRHKQRKIIQTTALLLQRYRALARCRVRFDVLVVRDGGVDWLQAAFAAT